MTRPINVELSKETKQLIYAVAGAADFAISTMKNFPTEMEKLVERVPEEAERLRNYVPAEALRAYAGLIERGEGVIRGLLDTRPWRPSGAAPRSRTHSRVTRVRVTSGGEQPAHHEHDHEHGHEHGHEAAGHEAAGHPHASHVKPASKATGGAGAGHDEVDAETEEHSTEHGSEA